MVPGSAIAITASALAIALAVSVVPSSGSSAMSTARPPCPTFSPMNSMGASSRSPSPITTVPSMGSDIEGRAHRFDRGLVGGMFVAAPDLGEGRDGGGFGDAHRFQRKSAVQRFDQWRADEGQGS